MRPARYNPNRPRHLRVQRSSGVDAVIQLGRKGDILNALPLCEYLYNQGTKPKLFVAEAYKDIQGCVSYADLESLSLDFTQHSAARSRVQSRYPNVVSTQVYGQGINLKPSTDSFCIESFKTAGFLEQYEQGFFDYINIDQRDEDAEARLAETSLPKSSLPVVLFNACGTSSPFPHSEGLLADLRATLAGVAELVDLSKIHATRFSDLLGLYDRAVLLITTDTATLHLAGASTIPYIALVTDQHSLWHGALCRGNCILKVRYSQFEKWREIITRTAYKAVRGGEEPQYLHAFQVWGGTGETRRRNKLAQLTWRMNYARGFIRPLPVAADSLPRLFLDRKRRVPFIKDIIDYACAESRGEYILLTNSDTCFPPEFDFNLAGHDLRVFRRRDFPKLTDPLLPEDIVKGHSYVGADAFVFPVEWWRKRRNEMPDLILSLEAWDCLLREIMLRDGAKVDTDSIYHERHDSEWERSENRWTIPGQLYCLRLAREKLVKMGLDPTDFGVR